MVVVGCGACMVVLGVGGGNVCLYLVVFEGYDFFVVGVLVFFGVVYWEFI